MNSDILSERIAGILLDKKARDIDTIKIDKITILADYFVIATGTSTVNIRSLSDEVKEVLESEGVECLHVEGYVSGRWILMDYGSVIVHIFHEEERKYYSLERLWSDGVMKRKEI